jgi:hypothetical protein
MKDAKFYAERYLRRRVQKVFTVNMSLKTIYIDKTVTQKKTLRKQIQELKDEHEYTEKDDNQTKMFNVSDFTVEAQEKKKRTRQKLPPPQYTKQQTLF